MLLSGHYAWYTVVCADCGWMAPTANFNPGKKAERKDRVDFKIK